MAAVTARANADDEGIVLFVIPAWGCGCLHGQEGLPPDTDQNSNSIAWQEHGQEQGREQRAKGR